MTNHNPELTQLEFVQLLRDFIRAECILQIRLTQQCEIPDGKNKIPEASVLADKLFSQIAGIEE